MASKLMKRECAGEFSNHQRFFVQYVMWVLADLVVLGLFDEFWEMVLIDSFSFAMLAAFLMQVMLKLTLRFEHRMAEYFKTKSGLANKLTRFFATWAVLFVSKLLILEAISYACGSHVVFTGPYHGVVAFIVVVTVIDLPSSHMPAVSSRVSLSRCFSDASRLA